VCFLAPIRGPSSGASSWISLRSRLCRRPSFLWAHRFFWHSPCECSLGSGRKSPQLMAFVTKRRGWALTHVAMARKMFRLTDPPIVAPMVRHLIGPPEKRGWAVARHGC